MRIITVLVVLVSMVPALSQAQRPRTTPVPERALDEAPTPLPNTCRRALYPPNLRGTGLTGRVVVRAVLDTAGRPEVPSLAVLRSSLPDFDLPAKASVLSCRYRPGRIAGTPVRTEVTVTVNFFPPMRTSADSARADSAPAGSGAPATAMSGCCLTGA